MLLAGGTACAGRKMHEAHFEGKEFHLYQGFSLWDFNGLLAETHRERMLSFVQTISTSGELSEGPGGCSLGLYLGFLPQDPEVHWGTTWRLPEN